MKNELKVEMVSIRKHHG